MMTEKLLQFLWRFQYFNKEALTTTNGESLFILQQGLHNQHQGPDFQEATVTIGSTQWTGNIEIHIRSSDWLQHKHTADAHYANIILHVVWQHDTDVQDIHGNTLMVLELQDKVPKVLIERYIQLMLSPIIPCQNKALPALDELAWTSWKERLAAERLERKAAKVLAYHTESNHHWEEVFWWMLASNFGMKVNAELFEHVARTLPIHLLARHKNALTQLEALLFGQANLLNGHFTGEYPLLLQREYLFLQGKYQLLSQPFQPLNLRMRPANLPGVRLAQLAMLVYRSEHLFATIRESENMSVVYQLFDVAASGYWNTHYLFDKAGEHCEKRIGRETVNSIIINTIVPVLFAYGMYQQNEYYKSKAIRWLMQTGYENNSIVQGWKGLGQKSKTALDSQAFTELTNMYCNEKRCLECAVGVNILRKL